ncbi:MAG: beta-(1,2)-glucan production associated transrane protein, partial [Proteobacteria bacterium]|nr:beta-(1,2)-glucan production associated transrane protein [Pseudomonadota bacterium]
SDPVLLPIGILSLLAASQLAVALVNWLATLLVTPHPLPKMDFSEGIPPQSRTLVVVPTMLTSAQSVENLVEALEVRFLANRDECLHFGLLTDLRDAQQESLPEDGPLVRLAQARIDELNEKYGDGGDKAKGDNFFLFHRPRRWNPQERIWMGYERKRGKLADLNALLRSGKRDAASAVANSGFSLVVGDTAVLSDVKYVVTLDTDTQLPRDAARQFVIDPYTRAVSDVYQDVFGEGSFIGKGIYDVDAFEQALGGRFPENRILSHDLLEGCYARAGLLSDAQLYEDYPARYSADVSRRHRWIRGDWQIAGWLLSRVPSLAVRVPACMPEPPAGRGACSADSPSRPPAPLPQAGEGSVESRCATSAEANPLSELSQWKLFDNLRRSLVPAALTLLFLLGWTVLSSAWFWTLSLIGILLLPPLCASILDLFRKPEEVLLRQHLAAVAGSTSRHMKQVAFEFACLPYEAYFSLDAIVRTAWRMVVARRRLLEWNPSSEAERESTERDRNGLAASIRSMWVAPVIATAVAVHLAASTPAVLAVAGPVLFLWFAAPGVAWWLSRPLARRKATLTGEQTLFLRALSRRTWAFFDHFVGPQDHWLPPDNYQEYRVASVAHRTSPTNMGLALLANLSAYDFGYIPAGQLIERTANTLRTMEGLERYRGHFYNWYDTQTLQPLPPLYVSTVDSGNLGGHLLTLRAGLLALADDRILGARLFDGLSDTLRIFAEAADASDRVATGLLTGLRTELESASAAPPTTLAAARLSLERLAAGAADLVAQVESGVAGRGDTAPESEAKGTEAKGWAQALERQCREALAELTFLAESAANDAIPTLRELAKAGSARARDRMAAIERLALQSGELADMEYDFLFDKARHLLTIGYNVGERRADASYYDLLASEARLCSFVAIAQGQLPQESWFALGRLLIGAGGEPVLLSWSGSMFEYLMPLLVMPTYDNTLLDQTCKAAVARQIEYGSQRGVPWGMSESGYNTVDVHLNYQYRAFGVPGLGLKRGLAEDLVVAPYASALALMVAPEEACLNLQRLAAEGFVGRFGLFEAIDYTPARQRRGQSKAVVRAFMAHHQGMSLLALAYLVLERPMQRRFESEPLFQAIMLLLQERIP